MVIIFGVSTAAGGVEEVVAAGEQLKDETGSGPDVGRGAPLCTEDDFGAAILAGLDVVGKMVICPGGVAKIGNLDGDAVNGGDVGGGLGGRVGGGDCVDRHGMGGRGR